MTGFGKNPKKHFAGSQLLVPAVSSNHCSRVSFASLPPQNRYRRMRPRQVLTHQDEEGSHRARQRLGGVMRQKSTSGSAKSARRRTRLHLWTTYRAGAVVQSNSRRVSTVPEPRDKDLHMNSCLSPERAVLSSLDYRIYLYQPSFGFTVLEFYLMDGCEDAIYREHLGHQSALSCPPVWDSPGMGSPLSSFESAYRLLRCF